MLNFLFEITLLYQFDIHHIVKETQKQIGLRDDNKDQLLRLLRQIPVQESLKQHKASVKGWLKLLLKYCLRVEKLIMTLLRLKRLVFRI